jgi:hypothetical protein
VNENKILVWIAEPGFKPLANLEKSFWRGRNPNVDSIHYSWFVVDNYNDYRAKHLCHVTGVTHCELHKLLLLAVKPKCESGNEL